ncbi:hypothetical protein [Xenorhabdus cabanillasii]|uniref:DUF3742 family protein n=1 Tax=Xenorhabdus cabanillasii JM26 TaxID=1427517 RepID=W1J7G7_9GAMM|nr:hypothetical protein [Xenorhabdus cabanillasii]PHM75308.1 hypothetical protein Xcab_04214 [Xenorhabdus cabanillasii JM26]CDL86679.1 conserved hypothetical protein [Xenorhabdus cabanillasii JM26]
MRKKTKSASRGEQWGINASHFCKWFFKKLKAWDATAVKKAKSLNIPGWLGHVPAILLFLLVITIIIFSIFITVSVIIVSFIIVNILSNTANMAPWKHGHYDLDGYHYPDGSIDQSDR